MRKFTQKEILAFFHNMPIVRGVIRWSKANSFPGFSGVPIYDVTVFLYNEIKRFTLTSRANSIAFSFFLSLFPFIIVLFTLIAYFPLFDNFKDILEAEINEIMPGNAGRMVFNAIQDITTIPRKGLMSLSFFLAMFFSSNGMIAMMHGFEKSYETTYRKRKAWHKRLIAIGLTVLLGILLVSSVVFIILGNVLLNWLSAYVDLSGWTEDIIRVLRWVGLVLLFYFGISMIYRYGPATRKRFSFFTPGATLATILSILSSVIFSFYVESFGTYNKLYGSIGTIIVVMLWIQINAFVLLVGYELNASIAVNRDLKEAREE